MTFRPFSFAVTQLEKEELQKKYIHVAQILESEKTARWQLLQQCEEQSEQIASLKAQVQFVICTYRVCLTKVNVPATLPRKNFLNLSF